MSLLYNFLFRRTSTYAVAVIAGAFVFERALDIFSESVWKSVNRGKLFEDVDLKYKKLREGAEDDDE